MSGCPREERPADVCLTQPQALDQLIKLLPRGRAWTTNVETPVRLGFLGAMASIWAWLDQRLCAARLEFFCHLKRETEDLWLADYGLPDACDPFPDLCAKVRAVGGTRCDYYVEIAARAGWSIFCVDRSCGAQAGLSRAGCAVAGLGWRRGELAIRVDLGASPAYAGGYRTPPQAGAMMAGQPFACPPDISALRCLLERVVHAHVLIVYELIAPPGASPTLGWLVPVLAA